MEEGRSRGGGVEGGRREREKVEEEGGAIT